MLDSILNNNNNKNLSTFSWHLQKWLNKKNEHTHTHVHLIKTATTSEKNKSFWNWIEFNCFDSLACIPFPFSLSLCHCLVLFFFSRASLRALFFFKGFRSYIVVVEFWVFCSFFFCFLFCLNFPVRLLLVPFNIVACCWPFVFFLYSLAVRYGIAVLHYKLVLAWKFLTFAWSWTQQIPKTKQKKKTKQMK